jgi:hypothetical protein
MAFPFDPSDPIAVVATVAMAVLVTILTLPLKSTGLKLMLALFISILFLLVVLAVLGLDTYPFSDVLVLGFAVLGGSLLGRRIWKRRSVFLVILFVVSAQDVLSFVSGPNAPSASQPTSPQGGSALLHYLNFTIQYGANQFSDSTRFIIGSFDLLVLSMVVMFFALKVKCSMEKSLQSASLTCSA